MKKAQRPVAAGHSPWLRTALPPAPQERHSPLNEAEKRRPRSVRRVRVRGRDAPSWAGPRCAGEDGTEMRRGGWGRGAPGRAGQRCAGWVGQRCAGEGRARETKKRRKFSPPLRFPRDSVLSAGSGGRTARGVGLSQRMTDGVHVQEADALCRKKEREEREGQKRVLTLGLPIPAKVVAEAAGR